MVMDSASLHLDSCFVHGNNGPGVDVSGSGRVTASSCNVCENAGEPVCVQSHA